MLGFPILWSPQHRATVLDGEAGLVVWWPLVGMRVCLAKSSYGNALKGPMQPNLADMKPEAACTSDGNW